MNAEWIELTDRDAIAATYPIYRHCLYNPTPERFLQKVDGYLRDAAVRVYACRERGMIRGMLVAACTEPGYVELLGVAVDKKHRYRGVGAWMLRQLAELHASAVITAETDGDAVGFYRRCGFTVTPFTRVFDGQPVQRYRCVFHSDCPAH